MHPYIAAFCSLTSGKLHQKHGCLDTKVQMAGAGEGLVSKPQVLLGHFSSIVTTLTALPNKPWLVSSDREGKVRVSKLPKDVMQVQSYNVFCQAILQIALPTIVHAQEQHLHILGQAELG